MIRKKDALDYHAQGRPGKIEVVPTKPCTTQRDLSLAYSPGVAEPCREIVRDRTLVDTYTARGNLVGVITNGTAVLGLGNIGPRAAKPVMEGKGLLFKRLADIDVFDLELDAEDPERFIAAVSTLEPTFGGINLEDIKAPECFYIEEELKRRLNIPVFHDDQHGTAIITGAALLNACHLYEKKLASIKILCLGAGAAAVRCMQLWVKLGVTQSNITMFDKFGIIYAGRTNEMDPYKGAFAVETAQRTIEEAIVGKDVLIGLAAANIVTGEMLKGMGPRPLIFALANPDPEVPYEVATAARPDAIVATGRSDTPNQVNNVLGYPYIFRGALDVRARAINDEMKLAATHALAALAREEVPERVIEAYGVSQLHFGPEYIIPKPFDERVLLWVAPAVARAAMETGVAEQPLDLVEYRDRLERLINPSRQVMRKIFSLAKATEARIVFTEGEDDKILRAAQIVADEGICHPILLGRPNVIRARAEELTLDLAQADIIWPPDSPRLDPYVEAYWAKRRRKGMTRYNAQKIMSRERRVFGMMMVDGGDADGVVSGLNSSYPETIRPALQIIGLREGVGRTAGMYMLLKGHDVLFCADTTVNICPDAETLAEIAITTADAVRDLGIEPRVAMLSFANFGSVATEPSPRRVAEATSIVKRRRPDVMVDGEMQADVALLPALREDWSFSDLKGAANVLVFPDLDSGNIAYKLLSSFGGAEAVGPILLGMRKPVTVLSQNSAVETIVHMAAITVATNRKLSRA
ncbi:MAG TPA: NADP-dependent malic enzyme [Polyangiaceae bacterium]|nr:NADP-dependent malic enzyme [Polyangiaceae bacterium]